MAKTQLATEYAYRHASDYDAIWWVRSEEPAQLASDYAALAIAVEAAPANEADQEAQIAAAKGWLDGHGGWLLIFDNVSSPEDVADYLPKAGSGHVVITSRYQNWSSVAETLSVKEWPREESEAFLLKRTGQSAHAGELADELGNLPLALDHAAAYVGETGCSLEHYQELFKKRQPEMIELAEPPEDYDETIATTWSLSLDKVTEESPAAVELLNLCAFLAPDDIALDVIRAGVEHLPEALAGAAADDLAWNDVLSALRKYSLVQVTVDALSLHRLVQAVVRKRLANDKARASSEAAVTVLKHAFPFDSDFPETWAVCARLAPHALLASGHAEELKVAPEAAAGLLHQLGIYLRARAYFSEARAAHEHSLRIGEAELGPDHLAVSSCLNSLGELLAELGELSEARAHLERAVKIAETALGEDPAVTAPLQNLGYVLQRQGDLAGARTHLERALKIDEAVSGPDDPSVGIGRANLAIVLLHLKDADSAKGHAERAVEILEASYGPDHLQVGVALSYLSVVLATLGDITGARSHGERALTILRDLLGDDHPHTATVKRNLEAFKD